MKPDKPGLYFAKLRKDGWYDLIVNVQGESPMLYISHVYDRSACSGPTIRNMRPFEIAQWGPRLPEPEEVKEESGWGKQISTYYCPYCGKKWKEAKDV